MIEISSIEHLQKILQSDGRIFILDFYANWCGPCKMLTPLLEEYENVYTNFVSVLKINVDENSELLELFRVTAMPTIIFYQQGKYFDDLKLVGADIGAIKANVNLILTQYNV